MNKAVACSVLFCLGWIPVLWAQDFQNLDFEAANLSVIPPNQFGGPVSITNAIPFWTGYLGTGQVAQVLQNDLTLGQASIDILGPDWSFTPIFQGQYMVVLQAGGNPFGTGPVAASLSQTGLIPDGTKSIRFLAEGIGPIAVNLGGSNLNLISFPVSNENYSVYEADASAFAGVIEPLTFTALALSTSASDQGIFYLDDIMFSPDAIPEPSSLTLLAIVLVGLVLRHLACRKTA